MYRFGFMTRYEYSYTEWNRTSRLSWYSLPTDFSSPPPPPQKGIYCVYWSLSNEWLKCLLFFTTQKTPRLPMRVPVPYQPVTLKLWVNEGDAIIIKVKGCLGERG
jgi:hypothetical protein